MKLVSFGRPCGGAALGVQVDGRVAHLAVAARSIASSEAWDPPALPDDMAAFLATGTAGLDAARRVADRLAGDEPLDGVHAVDAVRLLPPVPVPPKCLCVARNYAAHAAETRRELPTRPSLFLRVAESLLGDGAAIVVPPVSKQVDWEGELAVVIGRRGRFIAREDAYDHIVGYAIFNDVSIRDYQMHTPQFTAGKNFDASGPFGPALVTADEIADPTNLTIRTLVNGEVKQEGNSGDMVFGIAELIAYVSEFTTLVPGDVIATGTPAGVGVARTPPEYLRPGDVCTVAIDGLGELTNPVVAG